MLSLFTFCRSDTHCPCTFLVSKPCLLKAPRVRTPTTTLPIPLSLSRLRYSRLPMHRSVVFPSFHQSVNRFPSCLASYYPLTIPRKTPILLHLSPSTSPYPNLARGRTIGTEPRCLVKTVTRQGQKQQPSLLTVQSYTRRRLAHENGLFHRSTVVLYSSVR